MSDNVTEFRAKITMTPLDAAQWFLRDMAEVSGYAVPEWKEGKRLSAYATYRPILTAPDPWYYAGIVALEACKICDLFPPEVAKETLREVLARMDGVIYRTDDDASGLAFVILGRLGKGALLMHQKVPDNLLAKVMLIVLGSAKAAAPLMPDDTAHEQIRAALKLGTPVWWTMFKRRYELKNITPQAPKLVPSSIAADVTDVA